MNRIQKAFFIFVILTLILLASGCIPAKKKDNCSEKNLQKPKNLVLESFKKEHPDAQVVDTLDARQLFPDSDIKMIIAFIGIDEDTDEKTYSNIAIIADQGTGFLDPVGGAKDYAFPEAPFLGMADKNTATMPLYNSSTDKITDFRIKYIRHDDKEKMADFEISSKVRE